MTATGSENYITEYDYTDSNGNYTTLLQKETRTIEVADSEENGGSSFVGLVSDPAEILSRLNGISNVKETIYTYDANGSLVCL